jgi:hypothetical protein
MELCLTLESGGVLPVSDILLTRALACPVTWTFRTHLPPESLGQRERALVQQVRRALAGGPCKATPGWVHDGGATEPLGPAVTIVSAARPTSAEVRAAANPIRAAHSLDIVANGTQPDPRPDPFVPRRRVHKVTNLDELISRFEHVATPVSALQTDLARVTLPDGGHASIIQDGVSDWVFLHHIFDEARWLTRNEANWVPLTLVGGVSQATEGRWVITPGLKKAYEAWNSIPKRTVSYAEGDTEDGVGETTFGQLLRGERVTAFPTGEYPCVVDHHPQRLLDAGRWKTWRTQDLPCFNADGGMIYRIEDRLSISQGALSCDSRAYALPPEARIAGPEAPGRLRPWTGLGVVQETSRDGPWLKVQLPGFEANNDVVDVRLGTPYSGKNGQRGLHMVPETGTEVLLNWTGRFDNSVILAGNARSQAAEYPSPSTYLEAEHKAQYADIHVVKVGDTTIDSKLAVKVKQQTDLTSARPLQVKANGADLTLRDGIVYTGRS